MAFVENCDFETNQLFVICGKEIVLNKETKTIKKTDIEKLKSLGYVQSFSESDYGYSVLELKTLENLPEEFESLTIREYFSKNGLEENFVLSRAKSITEWRKNYQFCNKCGAKLIDCEDFSAKKCEKCGQIIFPRIEPCVIVLVNKGDKILLVRHVQRNQDIFACVAGFIEAGETAEHAVHRELLEETGIKVKNVKYKGSQGWPFPDQLMLAFTAEYESGEIKLQEEEISEAGWFDRDNCPASPKPGSVAYRLIHNEFSDEE